MRELGSMLRIDLGHLYRVFPLGGLMVFFWVVPDLLLGMLGEGRQSFSISVLLPSLFLVVLMLVLFQVGRVEGADILYDVLPLRRRTVTISDYLVLLVLSFLFEIAVTAMILAMPMTRVNVGTDWPVAVLVSLVAALFGFAIVVPLIVKFGDRNREVVIFSILAVTALGVDTMGHAAFPNAPPPLLTGWPPLGGLWTLLAASLAAYVVSPLMSIRIYKWQDRWLMGSCVGLSQYCRLLARGERKVRELKNAIRLDIQRMLDSLFLVVVGVLTWVFFDILKELMGLVFVITIIAVMTTTSAFYGRLGLDGLKDADLLYDTLPLRRGAAIISHYLVSLTYLLIAEIIVVPVLLLWELLGMRAGGDWWAVAPAAAGIMLVVFTVMVPVPIRFTDARGGAVLVVVVVIVGVGVYLLGQLISPLPGWVLAGWPWLLLIAGLVTWAMSLLAAIRLYQRQDHWPQSERRPEVPGW